MKLSNKKIRALIIGHTGATGKALLDQLIASDDCESIVAFGRRESIEHKGVAKLTQHIVPNMLEIASQPLAHAIGANSAFCCIGTAFHDVFKSSKAAEYRSTDFGIATEFAKYSKAAGVEFFSFISGQGANSKSSMNMYRVKGEVEDFVTELQFERAAYLRPGSLDRGNDASTTEKILTLWGLIGLPVADLARAMFNITMTQTNNVQVYDGKSIRFAAKK
ncbi:hypothetical protein [Rheinheimera texasensis]|uniref:hypothetical protein n=1 Tax=Rheinheimera texasensis TaxID=306205 RepID=UPI0004E0BB73|nr:hypothetical protein [Rheinheimera texasensis]